MECNRIAFFYNIFVNDTLIIIESSHLGVHIRGIYTGVSLFADDLSLLLTTPEDVNKALAILTARGLLTRTTYNASKTDIVIFGETQTSDLPEKSTRILPQNSTWLT